MANTFTSLHFHLVFSTTFTVSPSQLERVQTYIQRQAEHHRKRTFVEEYRDLLRAHAIDFDERFLF